MEAKLNLGDFDRSNNIFLDKKFYDTQNKKQIHKNYTGTYLIIIF